MTVSRKHFLQLLGVLLAGLVFLGQSADEEKPSLFVYSLLSGDGKAPAADDLRILTDMVLSAAKGNGRFSVSGLNDIAAMLDKDRLKLPEACSRDPGVTKCSIEMAALAGARYIMAGTIRLMEGSHAIALRLVDASSPETINLVSGECRGCDLNKLGTACREAADELLKRLDVSGQEIKLNKERAPTGEKATVRWVQTPKAKLAKTETTVGQYTTCMIAGACTEPGRPAVLDACNWKFFFSDGQAVNCVSLDQARAFCEWAGGRLPAEDEWMAEANAAGQRQLDGEAKPGGQGDGKTSQTAAKQQFPWGAQNPDCNLAVWTNTPATGEGCGRKGPWPVCSKAAGNSASGLCDMAGNVQEWIFGKRDDKIVPLFAGGGWRETDPAALRGAAAVDDESVVEPDVTGFRCAK